MFSSYVSLSNPVHHTMCAGISLHDVPLMRIHMPNSFFWCLWWESLCRTRFLDPLGCLPVACVLASLSMTSSLGGLEGFSSVRRSQATWREPDTYRKLIRRRHIRRKPRKRNRDSQIRKLPLNFLGFFLGVQWNCTLYFLFFPLPEASSKAWPKIWSKIWPKI